MHHHGCFACFATQGVAAGLTGTANPRRPAPAVEKHDGLVTSLRDFVQALHQCCSKAAVVAGLLLLGQVHHFDARQRHSRGPRTHAVQMPTAADGFGPSLHRRCGRSQNDGALRTVGTQDGQISAVVSGGLFLFVGTLVFFIHHHQAEFSFAHGREDR